MVCRESRCLAASPDANDPSPPIFPRAAPPAPVNDLEVCAPPGCAVDLPVTSPVREAFSRDVLNMPVSSVATRWRSVSSAGRGDPPPAMATDREVLAFVRLKPGAIGYLSASTDTQGVKVISIGKADSTASAPDVVEVGGAIRGPIG